MLPEVELELDWRGNRYRDVTRGLAALARSLEKDLEKVQPLVRREVEDYMKAVVMSVRDRTETPYPAGTSPAGRFPGTLSRRSGTLNASLNPANVKTDTGADDITVSFTLTGIAAVHERGAIIRPKRSKFLTIPLPPALNSNGTLKRASARQWTDTFIIRSKAGNLLIVRKTGRGIEPLYVLKKSVKIPKRLAFQEAFEAGKDFLADRIAQAILREFTT